MFQPVVHVAFNEAFPLVRSASTEPLLAGELGPRADELVLLNRRETYAALHCLLLQSLAIARGDTRACFLPIFISHSLSICLLMSVIADFPARAVDRVDAQHFSSNYHRHEQRHGRDVRCADVFSFTQRGRGPLCHPRILQ